MPPSIGTSPTLGQHTRNSTATRKIRFETTSDGGEQGLDLSETRGKVDDAQLPRTKGAKHDRRVPSHTSVSPLLYGN
jgi:hypothetical protein